MEVVCITTEKDLFTCTTPTSPGIQQAVLEVVCITTEDPWWSRTVSLLTTEQPIEEGVYISRQGP
jgi:hypothetical protein